jgi:hypothetical protein
MLRLCHNLGTPLTNQTPTALMGSNPASGRSSPVDKVQCAAIDVIFQNPGGVDANCYLYLWSDAFGLWIRHRVGGVVCAAGAIVHNAFVNFGVDQHVCVAADQAGVLAEIRHSRVT